MTAGKLVGTLVLQLVLILVNAFFAASEIAVLQQNPNKLRKMAEEGDKTAARILKMAESPSGFLSSIQIGITLAGFLGSAFAANTYVDPLVAWLYGPAGFTAISQNVMQVLMLVLVTIVLSYFTLVLGELVPKQIALNKPFAVAKVTTSFIRGFAVATKPIVALLSVSTRLVLGLFGIKTERNEDAVTEDEIRMMVDVGHESGTIDSEEKEMIDNVFELDTTLARDVMTHRVDVVAIEADESVDDIVDIIAESGVSRFPVYDDSYDDILGVLNARTYLLNLRAKKPLPLRDMLRPACFVPETVKADVLLRDMQQRKDHMAIVLDEYGGFSGVVTLEDLIEEIVGNIYDEFDAPEDEAIVQVEENLWRIAGDTDIDTVEDELDVRMPSDREYDTLGGLVFSRLSSIPDDGKDIELDAEGLHIHTAPVEDHHVPWAMVSVIPPPEEEAGEEGDEDEPEKGDKKDRSDKHDKTNGKTNGKPKE